VLGQPANPKERLMASEPTLLPPPPDATIGTRWAIRAIYEPAHIQTVAGVVTVQIGTYGRFVLTDEGWVHDNSV